MAVPGSSPDYPKDYFRSPLGIPLKLSGNFAEMRDNHFHGGLDLKTNDSEGYRVYAAANGYISRVKISPTGYGNALYVAHPNGFTTVYAHLSRLSGPIADYLRRLQESRKSFEIDQYLGADRFPVEQGGVIALSGNSGSSSGPHLHFEIRKTSGQIPVNPLLFGLNVADTTPPRIYRIRLYALDDDSGVRAVTANGDESAAGKHSHVTLDVSESGGALSVEARSLEAWGNIGLGIQAHDYHDGSGSRLGAYTISLSAEGTPVFKSKMEQVSFDETRFINAHVDYAERKRARRWIQRSYLLPGNDLTIYEAANRGVLNLIAGTRLPLTYVVEDAHGNRARLSFAIDGIEAATGETDLTTAALDGSGARGSGAAAGGGTNGGRRALEVVPVRYSQPMVIRQDGIEAAFPARAFYDDLEFEYSVESAPPGAYSPAHVLHNDHVPVHKRYDLSITPLKLPTALRTKALIASVDEDGKLSSTGGSYEAGAVKTRLRSLGKFVVVVDTLAPTITSLDIVDGQRLGRTQTLHFRIDDDLAGISTYDGFIDGLWVLFAYDAKKKLIYHELDAGLAPGSHEVVIEVADQKGNSEVVALGFRK